MNLKGIIIAGTHSGVGKTTIAIGLMTALRKRGFTVQPFKAGPDYIDPSFHMMVCGRPSYNLDIWMMGVDGVKRTFVNAMHDADVGVIEGVMGLFDGKDGRDEEGSTAHIAKVLKLPVILIVDAGAMARSAGALVYGYEKFDPTVKIKGVICNRVGSERHFEMLKQAVEDRCNAKVLGYIPRDEEISLPERHLGLVMPQDSRFKIQDSKLDKIGELIEKSVDIEGMLRINERLVAVPPKQVLGRLFMGASLTQAKACGYRRLRGYTTRIAVAFDNAFCFYYQENLDMLKEFGVELVFFSPLKDRRLSDDINGIYLGGGYPELHAKRLESNESLRRDIKDFADKGFPIYAECGGLMYLGKGLKDLKGNGYEMVGIFPWVSRMRRGIMSLGYREIKAIDGCPFLKNGQRVRGHEFHYSEIDKPSRRIKRVYQLTNPPTPPFRKGGKKGGFEGYLYKNTLCSYVHLHFSSNPKFAYGFIEKCRGHE